MDKMFKDDELEWERFSCDCGDREHIMDVGIWNDNGIVREVSFDFSLMYLPFRMRLRRAWQLLRGEKADIHGFIARPEDHEEWAKIFEALVRKPQYTDGTWLAWTSQSKR